MSATPFVIVADLRTGSTLLSTSLDQHPEVRCYGELFHPDDFDDNRLEGANRFAMSGREVVRRVFDGESETARGFRAMIFLPPGELARWADAWEALGDEPRLKVLYLRRANVLAQYVSLRIAQQTGIFHPSDGRPALPPHRRPSFSLDPEDIEAWASERERLWSKARRTLEGKPSLDLEYGELVRSWTGSMQAVQEFLGLPARPLPQAKSKQETRPLAEIVRNYPELLSRFGDVD